MAGYLIKLDHWLSERLAVCANDDARFGRFRWVMKSLEWVGHGVLWFAGVIWLIVHTMQPHHADEPHYHHLVLLGILAAMVVDIAMVGLIKVIFRRSRPAVNIDDMLVTPAVDSFSFPSGHTSRAATVAVLTCYLLFEVYSLEPIGWPFAAWLFYVCLLASSRIMLGRHYPLDVLGGIVLGILQAYFIIGYIMPHLHDNRQLVSLKMHELKSTVLSYISS